MARQFKITVEDITTGIAIEQVGIAEHCQYWLQQIVSIDNAFVNYVGFTPRICDELTAFFVAFRTEDVPGSHSLSLPAYNKVRRRAYIRLLEIELENEQHD